MGYEKNHTIDCYFMYNPKTRYVAEMRDITWLYFMSYSKPKARDKVVVYLQKALSFEPEDTEAREGVTHV